MGQRAVLRLGAAALCGLVACWVTVATVWRLRLDGIYGGGGRMMRRYCGNAVGAGCEA